jgi:hypothetical protein
MTSLRAKNVVKTNMNIDRGGWGIGPHLMSSKFKNHHSASS